MRTQRGDNYKEDRYRQGMMRTQRGDNCKEDKSLVTSICTKILKDLEVAQSFTLPPPSPATKSWDHRRMCMKVRRRCC